jgi:redox-sensitive bicupin YhaK (pirin superfamily)
MAGNAQACSRTNRKHIGWRRSEIIIVHLLQLWVDLPAPDKMVEPRTQNLVGADLPRLREPGVRQMLSVASGSAGR